MKQLSSVVVLWLLCQDFHQRDLSNFSSLFLEPLRFKCCQAQDALVRDFARYLVTYPPLLSQELVLDVETLAWEVKVDRSYRRPTFRCLHLDLVAVLHHPRNLD